MNNIVVLDGHALNPGDISWNAIESLGDLTLYPRTNPEQIVERAKSAEILITNKVALTRELLIQLPKLKLITVSATGYNIIDTAAARELGITVCNVPTYGTESVAQFTFALLLELCHQIGVHNQSVHAGEWESCADFSFFKSPQYELSGSTLGIIGFGQIGQKVARIGNAFGMHVQAYAPSQKNKPRDQSVVWTDLNQIFISSDVISLHCPLSKDNARMINKETLTLMKSSAFLINTSRGGLIDEKDLADALNENLIAGAALDVVSEEPIKKQNPLLFAKNCVITPHIAWTALAARKRLMRTTAENIDGYIRGRAINTV